MSTVKEIETNDGKLLTDGAYVKDLQLRHGQDTRRVSGIIRAFEQDGETRWEISTGDEQWPAVGFLPENALTRSGS